MWNVVVKHLVGKQLTSELSDFRDVLSIKTLKPALWQSLCTKSLFTPPPLWSSCFKIFSVLTHLCYVSDYKTSSEVLVINIQLVMPSFPTKSLLLAEFAHESPESELVSLLTIDLNTLSLLRPSPSGLSLLLEFMSPPSGLPSPQTGPEFSSFRPFIPLLKLLPG